MVTILVGFTGVIIATWALAESPAGDKLDRFITKHKRLNEWLNWQDEATKKAPAGATARTNEEQIKTIYTDIVARKAAK